MGNRRYHDFLMGAWTPTRFTCSLAYENEEFPPGRRKIPKFLYAERQRPGILPTPLFTGPEPGRRRRVLVRDAELQMSRLVSRENCLCA
jgi:hypothetical protein